MKVLEHIFNTIIREQVFINNMQFGFMPSIPLMQFPYLGSNKKSSCKRRKTSTLHLSTWKRLSIVYLVEFFGGKCRNLELMNGLFKLLSLCMTIIIRKSESQTAIATQLKFQ